MPTSQSGRLFKSDRQSKEPNFPAKHCLSTRTDEGMLGEPVHSSLTAIALAAASLEYTATGAIRHS